MDSTRVIRRSARAVFSGTMVSRITGLGRDVITAAAFGGHPAVAAFLMAFRFTNLPRRLFGEGIMPSAFVPLYERLKGQDPDRARRFTRDFILGLSLFLIVLTCIGEWVVHRIAAGVSPDNQIVCQLTATMLPALLFICLYGVNLSFLNSHRVYFLPSLAPALFNIVWIVAVLRLWGVAPYGAMQILAHVMVVAYAAQWMVTLPPLIKHLKPTWHKLNPFSGDALRISRPLFLGILGAGATQINYALDPLFARLADPSGPAYLWYALRLQQLPLALFGIALSSALLPPLARAVATDDHERYMHFFTFAIRRAIEIMTPITLAIIALGLPSVTLIYGRGAFDEIAISKTTFCLWAYGLALLPTTLVLIQSAAFYAMGNYRLPAIASAFAVACNITLNSLFVFVFKWGAFSIALATSLSAGFQWLILYIGLHRRNRAMPIRTFIHLGFRSYTAAKAAAGSTMLFAWFVPDLPVTLMLPASSACFAATYFAARIVIDKIRRKRNL